MLSNMMSAGLKSRKYERKVLKMKYKAITRKEAEKICRKNGVSISESDGRTFFLTNEDESEVWEFNSKAKRDAAVTR